MMDDFNADEIQTEWGHDVTGPAVEAGHFFPEELPDDTSGAISRFLRNPHT